MKLICSLLLIISSASFGRDIFLVTHFKQKGEADLIKEILTRKFNIPGELVEIKEDEKPCAQIRNPIVQLCVKEDGSMGFVIVKEKIIKNSFQIFTQGAKNEEL